MFYSVFRQDTSVCLWSVQNNVQKLHTKIACFAKRVRHLNSIFLHFALDFACPDGTSKQGFWE